MANNKLLNVEALRGVAASIVVFYHIDKYYYNSPRFWSEDLFGGLFAFGHAGVEFFFVLSGFIIALVHAGDGSQPGKIRPFIEKRFVRIYPFYWLCLAIVSLSMIVVPGVTSRLNGEALIGSLFLVGIDPLKSVVFVAWTLFHEILFYAIFALFIWNKRMGAGAIMVWSLGSFAAGFFEADSYLISPMNVLFPLGIGCSLLLKRHVIPKPGIFATAGAVSFLLVGMDDAFWHSVPRLAQICAYGLASSATLVGVVELERSRGLRAGRLAVLVGQASYSIYLTHMLSLTAMTKVAVALKLATFIPGSIAFVIFWLVAVGAGVVIHLWVEKPLMAMVRPLIRKRQPDNVPASAIN